MKNTIPGLEMEGGDETLLSQIIANFPVATFVIDVRHRVLHWNKACEYITGVSAETMIGTTRIWEPFYPEERPVMADLIVDGKMDQLERYYAAKYFPSPILEHTWEAEDYFPRLPGGGRWLAFSAAALKNSQGEIIGAIETLRDITAEKESQQALEENQHLLGEIIDGSPVPIFVLDREHRVTHWNRACEALNGVPAESMVGTRKQWQAFYAQERPVMADLVISSKQDTIPEYYQAICSRSPLIAGAWEATAHFPDFQSGPKWLYFTAAPLYGLDGGIVGAVETLQDVTARKEYELELEHKANFDTLTGLANRNLLDNRLQQAIIMARRSEEELALLFLDLDNFKEINDTLGHVVGDTVLKRLGRRISGCVREVDTVARIGGDEYVVLLYAPENEHFVTTIVRRLLDEIGRKLPMDGRELYLGCSIGIALYPKDGDNAETLMMHADTAMYRAKANDKGWFRYYAEGLTQRAALWLDLKQDLHNALSEHQMELYYQPQYDLRTEKIVGVEALVRWNHPTMGLLLPDSFIPIAEETGLIMPLGDWIMRTAVAEACDWEIETGYNLRVSVNVSARQFRYQELLQMLQGVVQRTCFKPINLELELTESLVMNNPRRAAKLLNELKEQGFSLAMDDFGTGYSSLAYLRRFPFDMIKIDKSFICDLGTNSEAEAIVRAMLSLGKALGLRMVAEGVETEIQKDFLEREGCDEIQGYLYSRPLPADAFFELLKRQAEEE
ncbi:sensor domain-containing protein [Desulfogranum mediterraneum]|uniref:sensor domain-containing protein n=1 Tax=Desulfogranum mediterraneum TaxID=160661 RepID=UPI0012947A6D|nr:bifunctional diguanylate cyclase/phosphodiesterase [Desulfogranum mediterraneum]